ncbi:2,4-dihydroxyhept-2-ene-1,7-dioic acid aldolase [Sinomonas cellulolyticus]|uniref:HpcH/HpaI aldolase/citrate lyase family protein n=1 Tax=Sinomonas cellulolyticus TaxID=2801916 RepID=A0ABS1K4L5_9MICC|nr:MULTISPECIES: HpcH/HpaI aldolase/citrate lyase family protein [Sinomonas]MBL0706465.1 HpcH/HpaI aldolase/citrate lyase family protein [Sinomonas cellulolyticus]GHG44772.1 2,4-dihydroxyhept-2-ene-1,7-dioic acid aldolase [Sinomonas sp. KCTC 49339]
MPFRLEPERTFRHALAAAEAAAGQDRPAAQIGLWVCSGSPLVAEIMAGSGADWLLIDTEHSPNSLESVLAQLHAVHGYPVLPMVRLPWNDVVLIKQYLDLGAQNLLIPMVNDAEQARAAVAAVRYPPHGVRGVGSALARAARWNRIPDYLARADETISLAVQIETAEAVSNVEDILAVDGVDAIFIGPSDLAASMGFLGQQEHPEVRAAVERCLAAAAAAGKPAGVNAFVEATARHYIEHGARFVLVGADVAILARSSEELASRFAAGAADDGGQPASY